MSEPLPPAIEEVLQYRRASRLIVRDPELSYRSKAIGLVNLVERARREAALPVWCQEAIWRESGSFLKSGELPVIPPSNHPVIGALRRLRRQGRGACPECRRTLPSDDELDRWEGLRWAEIVELQTAEAAV